jgi:hypothetical protein
MPYVTIDVLQEDIDRALRDRRLRSRRGAVCPVARAACRALGLALGNVKVGPSSMSIWGWKDHDFVCIPVTQKIARAVATFDRQRNMPPDRFRMTLTLAS